MDNKRKRLDDNDDNPNGKKIKTEDEALSIVIIDDFDEDMSKTFHSEPNSSRVCATEVQTNDQKRNADDAYIKSMKKVTKWNCDPTISISYNWNEECDDKTAKTNCSIINFDNDDEIITITSSLDTIVMLNGVQHVQPILDNNTHITISSEETKSVDTIVMLNGVQHVQTISDNNTHITISSEETKSVDTIVMLNGVQHVQTISDNNTHITISSEETNSLDNIVMLNGIQQVRQIFENDTYNSNSLSETRSLDNIVILNGVHHVQPILENNTHKSAPPSETSILDESDSTYDFSSNF